MVTLAISYFLIFFLIQMKPLKKKTPKTMFTPICKFKARNMLEGFYPKKH